VVRQRRAPPALPERLLRDGVPEQHDRRPHHISDRSRRRKRLPGLVWCDWGL
jgi:hypothetical protein